MRPPEDSPEDLTSEEVAALGALLVAERPVPREAFAAELDARVAARFARQSAPRASRPHGLLTRLRGVRRPLLPAAATTLAVALAALVLVLSGGNGTQLEESTLHDGAAQQDLAPAAPADSGSPAAGGAPATGAAVDSAAGGATKGDFRTFTRESAPAAGAGGTPTFRDDARKVERSAVLELGADADHVDDVAQGVLGVVARFDGIVDRSSVSSSTRGSAAEFQLRIPSARLQPALAALSRLPDARVLARSDEAVDVNEAYTSIRRQLANWRAERSGLLRALAAADTEDETLRLRARLDAVERSIARAERGRRALDRRVDYARVAILVRTADGAEEREEDGGLTIGGAFDDAGRVLEVAAAVVVIAAAALLPVALLAALVWAPARLLARRRREQALESA